MKYSAQLLDEIRARLPVSRVVARRVQLKRQGREYAGLSPFKMERTASFFVNDQKGFYHCFASGEHGDIFAFLMKTEGVTFPEAVERLASEAGVQIPKTTREQSNRIEGKTRLLFVMEAAAKFYEESLAARSGAPCLSYAEKRGLSSPTIKEFRLGYAPNERYALKQHLASKGFTVPEMIEAGMLVSGQDVPVPFDRFRHRLMFPICDSRGRVIAFGGRALDADQVAKYLNSPETPLFHKGSVLFNAHRARQASHEKKRLIIVEGYLDVVSLAQAGFTEAVAPLGTALTEDQLRIIWRMTGVPHLCFDGDSAGRRAAHRAVDIALPYLSVGQSLGFTILPGGLDPDDFVRANGAEAFERELSAARPLVDVLFEREWAIDEWTTPEKRAQLRMTLSGLVGRIQDRIVREHYEADISARLDQAWPKAKRILDERRTKRPLVAMSIPAAWPHRETIIMAQLLRHPWLFEAHAEAISEMPFACEELARLRDAILSAATVDPDLDSDKLCDALRAAGHADTVDRICGKIAEAISFERTTIEADWLDELSFHQRTMGLKRALREAQRDWAADGSQEAFDRIKETRNTLDAMRHEERKI